ncbi:hypothetical protein Cni_G26413 [Canna indica]|uniref:Uncharacterized protein n=1 Tax=Canna indica TaxID=4628 RepID=A0AAQ3KZQ1_9LILI|nr:hypothetical protein Cni_G26413 [Canna indica]
MDALRERVKTLEQSTGDVSNLDGSMAETLDSLFTSVAEQKTEVTDLRVLVAKLTAIHAEILRMNSQQASMLNIAFILSMLPC